MTPATEGPAQPGVILMFGGPGAGKGTQADLLSRRLGLPHISSGDLLREHQAQPAVIQAGKLLPDALVASIVFARLSQPDAQRGAILDGFPRTLAQAQQLDDWLGNRGQRVRVVLSLDVPASTMLERLASRRQASQRSDDLADVGATRIDIFDREMPPLLEHYTALGVVRHVDGDQSVDAIHQSLVQALEQSGARGSA